MNRLGVFVGSTPLPLEGLEPCAERTTPWGAAAAQPMKKMVQVGECTHELIFLQRHGVDHEFAPHQINYRANVWLMHALGLDGIVATYTVGSVAPELDVGDLVVPEQIIDYTWGRESTFDDQLRHIDFTDPDDHALSERLLAHDGSLVRGGVYGATQGPRLESAAEIVRMSRDGCTLVGMTGMPEASLCRELEIPMTAMCLVVNPAAGVAENAINLDAMAEVAAQGAQRMTSLLLDFVAA